MSNRTGLLPASPLLPEGSEPRPGALFTVPPGLPFLDTVAHAVLSGDLPRAGGPRPTPMQLPDVTILLPTRRAARAMQDGFLKAAGGAAILLPQIRPIGDGQEDLALMAEAADPAVTAGLALDVPPAIGDLERRLLLTELVMRWSTAMRRVDADPDGPIAPFAAAGAQTAAQAANLAGELARLLDLFATEGADINRLRDAVDERYSEHWRATLDFLRIVLEWWPAELENSGKIAPADRRNMLVRAEAARLQANPPAAPVIVAGVTGSIPATVDLMRVIASLPAGAIVLPGLDKGLDDEGWAAAWSDDPERRHPEHPQAGLSRLLQRLGVDRAAVVELAGAALDRPRKIRNRVVSEALRPAGTTERWRDFIDTADRDAVRDAFADVSLIEAPTAEDEAEVAALILREAVETPGQTAALLARDRILARRVAIRLQAWGIRVDDSAGRPFAKTIPGAFLDLLLDAVATGFAPAPTMALLKHPLTRLGLDAFEVRRAARAIEVVVFRTPYLGRGIDGIDAALESARMAAMPGGAQRSERLSRAARRLWAEDWEAARDLVRRMRAALGPLEDLFAAGQQTTVQDLARAHATAGEALAVPKEPRDGNPLWDEEAGDLASRVFADMTDPSLRAPTIAPADYPEFYRGLFGMEPVRPRVPVHPRVFIWGPFESRLQQPDVLVIGGLNEGTWPETLDPGPWLSRPMLADLGLPQPEDRLGYAAHDFSQAMGAPRVYLTRAQKSDGVPRVASRWLLRLDGLLQGLGAAAVLAPDKPWLAWALARTQPGQMPKAKAPAPCPPADLRTFSVSVSDVETWIANPYAIYAKRILGLEPLPPLGQRPEAAVRGTMVHGALAALAKAHPRELPDDVLAALMDAARDLLGERTGDPRIAAFWIPRFERFARWFAATESARRVRASRQHVEIAGALVLGPPERKLTARADRIDVLPGAIAITDYKTMSKSGLETLARRAAALGAPQLALEALIAARGGFDELGPCIVQELRYISASGAEPAGVDLKLKIDDMDALIGKAEIGLRNLIAKFDDPGTPYRATRRSGFNYDYDDFAHLARVDEWAGADADGGDAA